MILVTGATGLVGAHLTYELSKGKVPVRALYRQAETLGQVKKVFGYFTTDVLSRFNKIEWVQCDITDVEKLADVFKGVTIVYHCAAFISFDPSHYQIALKTNQEGTANVVNLSLAFHVEKLCHVSSIATLGLATGKIKIDEEAEHQSEGATIYSYTKHQAELEVWRGVQEGLNAVIINPGIILGPGFWHKGSGVLFSRNTKRRKHYFKGGSGFVSVNDVVKAMVMLMASDIKNERFILVAENLGFKAVQKMVLNAFGLPLPNKTIKEWQLAFFWRLDWLYSKLTKKPRKLVRQNISALMEQRLYDNRKIRTAINFQFEPIDEAIVKCCHLFLKERA